MSVKPEIAASLLDLQSKLGDDLGGVLDQQAANDLPPAELRLSVALEHLAGIHAGGAFPLESGSYRFGPSPGSVVLDAGQPEQPRFGLTIDPAGSTTLHPPPTGLRLDGVELDEPAPIAIGQVIASGHDRFVIAARRLSRRRNSGGPEEQVAPPPQPAKGRGVDAGLVAWARAVRNHQARLRRAELAVPAEIHVRAESGELFGSTPDDPSFGTTTAALADLPYELPQEVAGANRATQKELQALDVLPGVPLGVDFRRQSLAIVGPRPAGRAVATWLALSLAVQTSPAYLGLALRIRSNPAVWGCLSGLPHAQQPATALTLTVVDESRPVDLPAAGSIVLLEPGTSVPDAVDSVLTLHPDTASFTDQATGTEYHGVSPIGVSTALGLEWSLVMTQHLNRAGGQ